MTIVVVIVAVAVVAKQQRQRRRRRQRCQMAFVSPKVKNCVRDDFLLLARIPNGRQIVMKW